MRPEVRENFSTAVPTLDFAWLEGVRYLREHTPNSDSAFPKKISSISLSVKPVAMAATFSGGFPERLDHFRDGWQAWAGGGGRGRGAAFCYVEFFHHDGRLGSSH
jgi:hypothetical protein